MPFEHVPDNIGHRWHDAAGSLRLFAAVLGVVPSSGAKATGPECPCWNGSINDYNTLYELYADFLGEPGIYEIYSSCDPYPRTLSNNMVAYLQNFGDPGLPGSPAFRIGAISQNRSSSLSCGAWFSLNGPPPDPEDQVVAVPDLTPAELWACIRDVTSFCRQLGLPPIE